MYIYEIFLAKPDISAETWRQFLQFILRCIGTFETVEFRLSCTNHYIHYYLVTNRQLPATIENLPDFFVKEIPLRSFSSHTTLKPCFTKLNNFIEVITYFATRYNTELQDALIKIRKLPNGSFCYIGVQSAGHSYWLPLASPANFLSIDFSKNQTFFFQKLAKVPDVKKLMPALSRHSANALLAVSTFPYTQNQFYLHQNHYHFAKHSLVVGASGAGKSKFLSLFVRNVFSTPELKERYQVIIIDPHDALKNDLPFGQVIDFKTVENSIDLFFADSTNITATTEATFDLLRSLISQPNPKLERTLHHACYLLLAGHCFSFVNLRLLLSDLDFRNNLIRQLQPTLPLSVVNFFLADFNEMRTKYYAEAISPIIAFLDELETATVFSQPPSRKNLSTIIDYSPLTIFSLNRSILGQKATLAVSGLILQQLFSIIQSHPPKKKLLVIIDEVAVIETPTLARYLSEARKYNVALILATQYLGQVSDGLKKSIFANIANYYLFRIARSDAELFAKTIDLKFPSGETPSDDQKLQLFTKLNPRECLVQVDINDQIMPAFMAKTINF